MPFIYRQEDMEEQAPWDILHNLQCDLLYLLQETDSTGNRPIPKHAVDMVLKRTLCEIERAKKKIELIFIKGEDDDKQT